MSIMNQFIIPGNRQNCKKYFHETGKSAPQMRCAHPISYSVSPGAPWLSFHQPTTHITSTSTHRIHRCPTAAVVTKIAGAVKGRLCRILPTSQVNFSDSLLLVHFFITLNFKPFCLLQPCNPIRRPCDAIAKIPITIDKYVHISFPHENIGNLHYD